MDRCTNCLIPARPVASDIFDVQRFRNVYLLQPDKLNASAEIPGEGGWQWIMVEILVQHLSPAQRRSGNRPTIDPCPRACSCAAANCLSYFDRGSHLTALPGIAVLVGGRTTRITTLTNSTHAGNSSWNHLCSPAATSRVSATR